MHFTSPRLLVITSALFYTTFALPAGPRHNQMMASNNPPATPTPAVPLCKEYQHPPFQLNIPALYAGTKITLTPYGCEVVTPHPHPELRAVEGPHPAPRDVTFVKTGSEGSESTWERLDCLESRGPQDSHLCKFKLDEHFDQCERCGKAGCEQVHMICMRCKERDCAGSMLDCTNRRIAEFDAQQAELWAKIDVSNGINCQMCRMEGCPGRIDRQKYCVWRRGVQLNDRSLQFKAMKASFGNRRQVNELIRGTSKLSV